MKISQQIFPRVVALIATFSNKQKRDNVMTASFVMPLSFEPKYLAFSISPKRYTFEILNERKEFTFNICDENLLECAKICGSYCGREKDKFKLANLTKEKSKFVLPPTIKECPISFECQLIKMEEFGDHFLAVGKVLNERVRKENFSPLLHKSQDIFLKVK